MSLHGMAVLLRTKPAGTLILNFMASRTQKLMSALSHPVNVILLQQLKLMKTAGKAQTAVSVGLALWYPILIFHPEPSELRDGGSSIPCKPSCSMDSVVPGPAAQSLALYPSHHILFILFSNFFAAYTSQSGLQGLPLRPQLNDMNKCSRKERD